MVAFKAGVFVLLLAGCLWAQDQGTEIKEFPGIGRTRRLEIIKKARDVNWKTLVIWPSIITPGEEFESIEDRESFGIVRAQFRFMGVENGSVKLEASKGSAEKGEKGLKKYFEGTLHIPAHEGKFFFYPPELIDEGVGFQITPNTPKPGQFEMKILLPKKDK